MKLLVYRVTVCYHTNKECCSGKLTIITQCYILFIHLFTGFSTWIFHHRWISIHQKGHKASGEKPRETGLEEREKRAPGSRTEEKKKGVQGVR